MPPTTEDADHSKKPISGMNLSTFILLVWHRGKAKANRLLANMPPEARTTHESTRRFPLPYEILEMITAHLTHDLRALKTCSLTCRSWYTLVVLHLHHTLTITGNSDGPSRRGLEPLSKLHELGLIPLVKELRIRRRPSTGSWGFGPQAFGPRDLGYFTALANVQFLRFHDLEVNRFLPGVERYFGHLSPTLRSISVSDPRGTPQELSHFLSLFPNLDDVEIQGSSSMSIPLTTPGLTNLVPLSAPKLRGRLVLHNFRWAETWAYFITSSSGPRFRYIDLGWRTGCASVLFEECAKTLETLRYNATDTTIRDIGLSRLKVLRSLQLAGWATTSRPRDRDSCHTLIMEVFSTVTSPAFSELVLVFPHNMVASLPKEVAQPLLEILRKMNEIRPFKLVFLLEVPDRNQENARRKLAGALDLVTAKCSFDFLGSPPTARIAQSPYFIRDSFGFK